MNIDIVKAIYASLEDDTLLFVVEMVKQGLFRGSPHNQQCVAFVESDRISKP